MKNSSLDSKGKEEPNPMHNVCYLIDLFFAGANRRGLQPKLRTKKQQQKIFGKEYRRR